MSAKYRGQALIIVNENFSYKGKAVPKVKRPGAEADLVKMSALFEALDFKVSAYKDLTAKEMLDLIKDVCDDGRHTISECFALVISSHGEELREEEIRPEFEQYSEDAVVWKQYVLGSDYEKVKLDDVVHIFGQENSLKNKPKIFIFQACRGRGPMYDKKKFDEGVDIDVVMTGPVQESQERNDIVQAVQTIKQFSGFEDINKDWTDVSSIEDSEIQDHAHKLWKTEGREETSMEKEGTEETSMEEEAAGAKQGKPASREETPMEEEETVGAEPGDDQYHEPFSQFTESQREEFREKKHFMDEAIVLSIKLQRTERSEEEVKNEAHHLAEEAEGHNYESYKEITEAALALEEGTQMKLDAGRNLESAIEKTRSELPPEQAYRRPQVEREFSIEGVTDLPDDVLIVYPAKGGVASFHRSSGSRLLDCMSNVDHVKYLLQGENFLRYLTRVAQELAALNIQHKQKVLKTNIYIQHRLRQRVCFKPKGANSIMAYMKAQFRV